jgi:hypothetical protein
MGIENNKYSKMQKGFYNKMKFLFYSHKDYSDIWPIMFGQAEKYLNQYSKVLLTNEGEAPDDWSVLHYDDSLTYRDRVVSCLSQLSDDVIVFNHEDMFLYGDPNHKALKYFFNLVQDKKVSFIKLLRGGMTDTLINSDYDGLIASPTDMVFTIQPTVCNRENLITMYKETEGDTIWSFESNTYKTAQKFNFLGCMAFQDSDRKRGKYHYDSKVYPYIATSVVKGKWYTSDYPELTSILKDYNIDPKVRGEI